MSLQHTPDAVVTLTKASALEMIVFYQHMLPLSSNAITATWETVVKGHKVIRKNRQSSDGNLQEWPNFALIFGSAHRFISRWGCGASLMSCLLFCQQARNNKYRALRLTPKDNLGSPVNLTSLLLECEGKQEYPHVRQYWQPLHSAAMHALQNPG